MNEAYQDVPVYEFCLQRHRLCKFYKSENGSCENCVLEGRCNFFGSDISEDIFIMKKVHDFVRTHPENTFKEDFFNKFPNAEKSEDFDPYVCRRIVYPNQTPSLCSGDCHSCWNTSMKEEVKT